MITIVFLKKFLLGLLYLSPILAFLVLLVAGLGLIIGKREGLTRLDSIYFAFITATTVGYGDYRPTQSVTKLLSILITFTGLLLTGIIVAIGLEAAREAFELIRSN